MKSLRNLFSIFIALILTVCLNNILLAQEAMNPPEKAPAPEVKPEVKPEAMVDVMAEAMAEAKPEAQAPKAPACPCLKPASDAVSKAYSSIEEDEWPKAIKTCKDSIEAIKNLGTTCKCPEVAGYQKIVEAFLGYAQGGDYLDGTEKPDCEKARKMYADTISALEASSAKISDEEIKKKAKAVQEYAKEEETFAKEECL